MRKLSGFYLKLFLFSIVLGAGTCSFAQIIEVQSITCPGLTNGQLNIHPTFGTAPYSYAWTNVTTSTAIPGDSIIKGLGAADYSVTITDSDPILPIVQVFNYKLKDPLQIVTNIASQDSNYVWPANNGKFTLATTGGSGWVKYAVKDSISRVTVNTANPVFTGLASGTYFITTSDVNGCFVKNRVHIFESAGSVYGEIAKNRNGLLNPDTTACYKQSTSFTVAPDTLKVQFPVTIIEDGGAFKHILLGYKRVNDSTHVVTGFGVSSPVVKTNPAPGFYYVLTKTVVPSGPHIGQDSVSIGSFADALFPGFHLATIYTADGRGFRYSWDVDSVVAPVSINFTQVNDTCYGDLKGKIIALAQGSYQQFVKPYKYTISGPNGYSIAAPSTPATLAAGIYTISATDWQGCSGSQTVTIKQPDEPLRVVFDNSSTSTCATGTNGTINIHRVDGATYPVKYKWSTGDSTQSISNISVGTYIVTVTDKNRCTVKDTTKINLVNNFLNIAFDPVKNTRCPYSADGAINVRGVNGAAYPVKYLWSTGDTTQNIEKQKVGKYFVSITDQNGCMAEDSIDINSLNKSCFYNIITPNGDGLNDKFDLTDLCVGLQMKAAIFNEAGRLVTNLTEANPTWDAIDPSSPPTGPNSTYTAFVTLFDKGKKLVEFSESFSVIYQK